MLLEGELNCMQVLERGQDYIEVWCGCTSQKYGDYIGKLKVLEGDDIPPFDRLTSFAEEMTPYDFENHSQRTCLIKYFKHGSNEVSTSCRGKRNFHRDEFVTCSSCEKERCFHLQTKEDCMIYHAAAADKKWKCSDRPYDKITCVDDEERDSFTGDVLKVSRNARVALLVCVCWVPQVPFKGVRLQPLC
ncbi:hypothetical protein Q3G72_009141 [Acer saccharum]|nr:hypothetical protein Q3G72_009141 [Acer saccharum]